jgi:hypothetical protein
MTTFFKNPYLYYSKGDNYFGLVMLSIAELSYLLEYSNSLFGFYITPSFGYIPALLMEEDLRCPTKNHEKCMKKMK